MLFSPLFSGSSGNSTFVEAGRTRILIDAGLPGSRIAHALQQIGVEPDTISAILITHEHSDHMQGAGVLSRRYDIPLYANAACFAAMESAIGNIGPNNARIFETGREFYIGDICVAPFLIPHDTVEPVGFTLSHEKRTAGVLTDIGHMDEHLLDAVECCDLLLLESNHDVDMLQSGAYPYPLKQRILSRRGHLSNEDSARALCRLYARGLRHAILGHLSADNNDERIAMATAAAALHMEGISDMHIAMSHRDRNAGVFHLD